MMSSRPIVYDPDVLRWHIEGTPAAVAEVRDHFHHFHNGVSETFRYGDLSADEIYAVLDFNFPVIRETAVQLHYAAISISCECGEDIHRTLSGCESLDVTCICGREWTVALNLFDKNQTDKGLHILE